MKSRSFFHKAFECKPEVTMPMLHPWGNKNFYCSVKITFRLIQEPKSPISCGSPISRGDRVTVFPPQIYFLAEDNSPSLKPAHLPLNLSDLSALWKEGKANLALATALVCFAGATWWEINLLCRLRQLVLWVYKCSN